MRFDVGRVLRLAVPTAGIAYNALIPAFHLRGARQPLGGLGGGGSALLISFQCVSSLLTGLPTQLALFLAGSQQNSFRHQVKMLLSDPFSTVRHYWNWFDAALLIP